MARPGELAASSASLLWRRLRGDPELMARRVTLPSVDDLFRPTEDGAELRSKTGPVHVVPDRPEPVDTSGSSGASGDADQRAASGRVRHDEKMTVYVTSSELLALEHARLVLRGEHGLAVDRGRLVREAIALVLADLHLNGEGSALVRRLHEG